MTDKKEIKEKNEEEKPFWKELLSYVIIIAVVLFVKKYIASPIKVNGESMTPTLNNNDYMILDKLSYRFRDIKRFDIVVIEYEDENLIKRVIGLPGESIEFKNNKLYINGKYVKEDFTKNKISDYNISQLGSDIVPDDYYFVIGDNRPNSKDSRIIGFISRDDIIGKSSLTLFPFDRFGIKE